MVGVLCVSGRWKAGTVLVKSTEQLRWKLCVWVLIRVTLTFPYQVWKKLWRCYKGNFSRRITVTTNSVSIHPAKSLSRPTFALVCCNLYTFLQVTRPLGWGQRSYSWKWNLLHACQQHRLHLAVSLSLHICNSWKQFISAKVKMHVWFPDSVPTQSAAQNEAGAGEAWWWHTSP